MLCLMEVFGRMLSRRGIATADVAARSALAKRNPKNPLGQTLQNLALAEVTVFQVLIDDLERAIDDVPVSRKDPFGFERRKPLAHG